MGSLLLQGSWDSNSLSQSHNFNELYVIRIALAQSLPVIKGRNVRVYSDNKTAVAYINRQGGTRALGLMGLTHQIFSLAEASLLSLSAVQTM